jgi:hypothetical protein
MGLPKSRIKNKKNPFSDFKTVLLWQGFSLFDEGKRLAVINYLNLFVYVPIHAAAGQVVVNV